MQIMRLPLGESRESDCHAQRVAGSYPRKWASYCGCPGASRTAALAEQEVVNRLDPVPARWGWGWGDKKKKKVSSEKLHTSLGQG